MKLFEAISRASQQKPRLVVTGTVLAIAASALWMYRYEFGSEQVPEPLHQAVGHVMAEETARQVGHLGNIVLITMDTHQAPELKLQVKAFEKSLKLLGGITIKDRIILDPGDNPKY